MTAAAAKRVLIAGGAGFIGSHLVQHAAAQGHRVFALVRPGTGLDRLAGLAVEPTVIRCDLDDLRRAAAAIAAARPDVCIDAAWTGVRGGAGSSAQLTSLRNALGLAELMAEIGCPRYLHAGSCFEYAPTDQPIVETSPIGPHTLYGACKQAASIAIRMLGSVTAEMRVSWPRVFYVYGPHEAPHRLVPAVACGLLRGEAVPTTSGDQIRDYLHVADVAAALWAVAESGHEGPINVASGTAVPVRHLVELIGEIAGRPDLLRIGALPRREGDPPAIRADATRLRALGWAPRYSLEAGLRETVEWWRSRLGMGD